MGTRQISLQTIREAAGRVYDAVFRTPLVRLPTGADAPEVYLKLETLQPIGLFKIRGARNAVGRLASADLAGGVWTVSAGNAAQGVAFAARRAGVTCSVLVMDTAPETKPKAIERLGATIITASSTSAGEPLRTIAPTACRDTWFIRSTMTTSSVGTGRLRSKSSRICRTWMRSSHRWGAAGCSPASPLAWATSGPKH